MILVADSGSTKTSWILQGEGVSRHFHTIGLNPLFIDATGIATVIQKSEMNSWAAEVKEVYFYGASCSSTARNKVVQDGLSLIFTGAKKIEVDHDMKSASIALCGNKPGVACILGTGANSCLWDGQNIVESIEAPGFILGDEASGAYFGKKIIALYLYKRLPKEISSFIEANYSSKKDDIYKAVYQEKFPNLYLATYAKIYSAFRTEKLIQEILRDGFQEFVTYHLLPYDQIEKREIHFVGSIAYHFKEELSEVLLRNGLTPGDFLANPVERLLQWHLRANG
jgi:N-acetylglucosamine kinase-like BadF-type ATPase